MSKHAKHDASANGMAWHWNARARAHREFYLNNKTINMKRNGDVKDRIAVRCVRRARRFDLSGRVMFGILLRAAHVSRFTIYIILWMTRYLLSSASAAALYRRRISSGEIIKWNVYSDEDAVTFTRPITISDICRNYVVTCPSHIPNANSHVDSNAWKC